MAKKLRKSLQTYFSKLKKIRTVSIRNPPAATSLLSACKYPKTPSFDATHRHRHRHDAHCAAATLSDVDRFLFENFQSLYIRGDDDDDDEEESGPETSADAIKSSDRFFASPRTSSSLIDDAGTTSTTTSSTSSRNPEESVAVATLSRDPYDDFLRSMRDMVDARHVEPGQPLDWDFMEELLFRYLELNERAVHRHILTAFADLTVSFRRRAPPRRRKAPAKKTTTTKKSVPE